jgi:hypothetical protein
MQWRVGVLRFVPAGMIYDWLGHGIYFWENDPVRALRFAEESRDNPHQGQVQVENPAVLGAVIDCGNCLNLMQASDLGLVREAYKK